MIFAWLVACGGGALPAGDPQRPDVLIVSIDTLRADHLGAYGYSRDTSPWMDALARRGARFSQAWSPAPWTLPTHATLLTGRLPRSHGAIEGDLSIPADLPRLSQAFRDQGYATLGVTSTLYVSRKYGFEVGFDAFDDFGIDNDRKNLSGEARAARVLDRARDLAATQPDGKPLFVFLHLYDAHYPYAPPAPFDEKFDRGALPADAKYRNYAWYQRHPVAADQMAHQMAQYDEEIAYVDATLGAFIDAWTARRPAYVAVTADHGEEFGERGSWGHAHTLFPEQLHVPWIVAGPQIAPQVVDRRVGTEDIAPTLAGLAGVAFPSTDGADLSALLRGQPVAERPGAAPFAETSRFDTQRVRWHEAPFDLYVDLPTRAATLCDRSVDAACTEGSTPQDAARIDAMSRAWVAWVGAPWSARQAGVVQVVGGQVLVDGAAVGASATVDAGSRFAVWPQDAEVRFVTADDERGPWRVLAGVTPGADDPLTWTGGIRTGGVTLDDAERQALEALGYVQ